MIRQYGFLLFILTSDLVTAKTCKPISQDILYSKSQYVFEAKVMQRKPIFNQENTCGTDLIKQDSKCGPKVATLAITKVWKGKLAQTVTLYSEDACLCLGSYLRLNDNYVIFAADAPADNEYALIAPGCGAIRSSNAHLLNTLDTIRK